MKNPSETIVRRTIATLMDLLKEFQLGRIALIHTFTDFLKGLDDDGRLQGARE